MTRARLDLRDGGGVTPRVEEPDEFNARALGALEGDNEHTFLTTDDRRPAALAAEEDVHAHAREQGYAAVKVEQNLHDLHVRRSAGTARAHAGKRNGRRELH